MGMGCSGTERERCSSTTHLDAVNVEKGACSQRRTFQNQIEFHCCACISGGGEEWKTRGHAGGGRLWEPSLCGRSSMQIEAILICMLIFYLIVSIVCWPIGRR